MPFLNVDPMEGGARDLLRRFSGGFSTEEVTGGDSDEIELGLSLGGCFSSHNTENIRLTRSSSIPAMLQSDFPTVVPLVRSCSLPSEAEEEIRRRRKMQSIKRMEAKRKRKEKRKLKRFDDNFEGESVRKMRKFELEENGVESSSRRFAVVSLDSVASQGSSSSGGSEFESQPGQGFEFPGIISASDVSTHSNVTTTSKQNNHIAAPPVPTPLTMPSSESTNNTILGNGIVFYKNISRKNDGKMIDVVKNMVEEMPSVSTRGDGPDGRRINGLLYRYQKGEVKIICVCHGNFLTPAEFVKHGGGGDVAHPLRHIVVNPSSGSFL